MSNRFSSRAVEYTVTHRIGLGGHAERYQRPTDVHEVAQRLQRWTSAAEGCRNCGLPGVTLAGGDPWCSRCRDQRRAHRGGVFDAGLAARVQRSDDDPPTLPQLRGHAIVFNKKSVDLWGFVEIIRPAAADRMEAEKPDLRALWNHDSAVTLARVSAGTLRARKVTRGVAVEIDPPRWAHGYIESVERRDITGMSFGFIPLEDEWHLEDGYPVREIYDMDVIEVSPVSFPAYPDTDLKTVGAGARSAWTLETESAIRLRLAKAR